MKSPKILLSLGLLASTVGMKTVHADSLATGAIRVFGEELAPVVVRLFEGKAAAIGTAVLSQAESNPAVRQAIANAILTSGKDLGKMTSADFQMVFGKGASLIEVPGKLSEGLAATMGRDSLYPCAACGKMQLDLPGQKTLFTNIPVSQSFGGQLRALESSAGALSKANLNAKVAQLLPTGKYQNAARLVLGNKDATDQAAVHAVAALRELSAAGKAGAKMRPGRADFLKAVDQVASTADGIALAPAQGAPLNVVNLLSLPLNESEMGGWSLILQEAAKSAPGSRRQALQGLVEGLMAQAEAGAANEVKTALSTFKSSKCLEIY